MLGLWGRQLARAARADWRGKLDALLFAIGIPIAGATGIAWVGLLLANALGTGDWVGLGWNVAVSAALGYLLVVAMAMLVLRLERASWPRVWLTIVTFPLYLLSWSVLNIVVLFYRDPTWTPIPHTEAVAIEDLPGRAASRPASTDPVPLESEA